MVSDDTINSCINTTLGLGLGVYNLQDDDQEKEMIKKHDQDDHHLLPCLKLGLSPDKDSDCGGQESSLSPDRRRKQKQEASCCGSFSQEQVGVEVVSVSVSMSMSSRVSDHEDEDGPRKKLRLTKQQSATLEDTFKQHNTLNPKQKQFLAAQLSLRPRQVEVWFQNRRARTKLKQTEEECEVLKKYCETLREENKKLHKEVQELKALKLTSSFYMQLQPSSMCPSCERVITSSTTTTTNISTSDDVVGPNTRPFFMPSSA